MDKNFGGVIWTKHTLSRMRDRGIKQGDAWATWRRPDQSNYAKTRGSWVYYRTFGCQRIEVVAKKSERGDWVILSVWSKKVKETKALQGSIIKNIFRKIFGFDSKPKSLLF